jgi:5-methyltetrahydrofolate--homocysteine methyltransferase
MTTLTSRNGVLEIGSGQPTCLINDLLCAMDQPPEVLADLKRGRIDKMLELACLGQRVGTEAVDILVMHPDLDEADLLPKIAVAVHEQVGCSISLDTRDPRALEAALSALHPYKALVNSVSAERDCLEALLPVARKYGAAIVGMPVGHQHGVPKTVEERLDGARVIVEAAERVGISHEDILMDAICLASAVQRDSMAVTLDTLRRFHEELKVATILGIGNAGFGMPEPTWVDLAYLLAAAPCGLDAALVDPRTPGLIECARAADFLTGRDPYGKRYLTHYRAKQKGNARGTRPNV